MTLDREHLVAGLSELIGAAHVLVDADMMAPYLTDWRKRYTGTALCVVRPGTTAEVSAIMRFAALHHLALVPQGGNTGLVGGSVPTGLGHEIVVSLSRMARIRTIDAESDSLIVEAGASLTAVQEAAQAVDRLFPLSLASEGTATLGGAIATNAGGTAALAYGTMRDLVRGVEVVLPDGRVLDLLTTLRKDNTGYDLKSLFIGSEGTLGIVTAASVKLFALPRSRVPVFCGVSSPDAALALLQMMKAQAGSALTTFELLPRLAIDLAVNHLPAIRDPLSGRHDWYVMAELSSLDTEGAARLAIQLMEVALEKGYVEDAVMAQSLAQADAFWALREGLPEAQTREGASIKHDISVPIVHIPAFINRVTGELAALVSGIRPFVFGHMGDGNLHFNLQAPEAMESHEFIARASDIHALVYRHVIAMKGSISAEHGIGQLKREELAATKDPLALDVMRQIKHMLDPDGRMNPGKVL